MSSTGENDHPSSWDNSKLSVEVTHVDHPGRFFCRLQEDIKNYETFKRELRTLYEIREDFLRIDSERLAVADRKGLVVKHEGSYKRAKMLTVNDDQVTVFLLDEGRTEMITRNHCFMPAPNQYMKRPKFAFRCHMFDIRPKRSNGIDSDWIDNAAREYFSKAITNRRTVTLLRRFTENEIRFDGNPSLPVEISFRVQESDGVWARRKEINKFLSPMMIEKKICSTPTL